MPLMTRHRWHGPAVRRCAASFSFDVDAESAMLGVDPSHADGLSAISHQAYGPLTGCRGY